MTPEGSVKTAIKRVFRKHGVKSATDVATTDPDNGWYYMPVQTGMGVGGIPDFIACVKGHFLAVEAKADASKHPTDMQMRRLDGITRAGGTALVIHATNVEGLDQWLSRRTK